MNDLVMLTTALPLALNAAIWRMMDASRLARGAAAREVGRPPPPAVNYFVDYVGTGLLRIGFVIGPFTTGHSETPSHDTAEGDLSVWADMPPHAASRRRRGPETKMARATITITIIAVIIVSTGIDLITSCPDPSMITIWTATAGSVSWTSALGTM